MNYLLILQWPVHSGMNIDSIVAIEDNLIQRLSKGSEVDGHDFGSGEANIFIITKAPQKTFDESMEILKSIGYSDHVRIAFREISGKKYTVLWPHSSTDFMVK